MQNVIHTEDFTTAKGTLYRVEITPDYSAGTPWEECDIRGPVSEWTTRDKKPGELVLGADHPPRRYYDFQGAIKKAKTEGWGCKDLTGNETAGEKAVKAVMDDFNYLKSWCDDEWFYTCLHVVMLDSDGNAMADDYMGGVEYGISDYWQTVAQEMAEELERALETATDKQLALKG